MERSKSRLNSKEGKGVGEENLQREVVVAVKTLQSLATALGDASTILSNSRHALAVQAESKERIGKLEEENRHLQEQELKMRASFALSCESLTNDFQRRSKQAEEEFRTRLLQEKVLAEAGIGKLQTELNAERRKVQSLAQAERTARRDLENEHKKTSDSWKREIDSLQHELSRSQEKLKELQSTNADLRSQLTDRDIILRGHDKERDILRKNLAEYETFQTYSPERLGSSLGNMREALDEFCRRCIENADLLPGLNRVPDGLQGKELPLHLNMASDQGCQVFEAMIKDSVVKSMLNNVFLSAPSCSCGEMNAIAHMLHDKDAKLGAVWRCVTAKAVVAEPRMTTGFRDKLSKVADNLVTSWKLILREGTRREVHQRLTELFCFCLRHWLDLLTMGDRIYASNAGPLEYFVHDVADAPEKTVKMPGEFASNSTTHPILCTFPTITTSSITEPKRRILRSKGEGIFRDSPTLTKVIGDAQSISSTKGRHKA